MDTGRGDDESGGMVVRSKVSPARRKVRNDFLEMTTTSSKENGRSHKTKRRSVSNAASPSDDLNPNLNGEPSGTSSGGGGRGTKRVRDDTEDPPEEKRPRSMKKAPKIIDDNDMLIDGEPDGDEDGGDTRCVCGKGG